MAVALSLKKCTSCAPKLQNEFRAIETAVFLNMKSKGAIAKILKKQTSDTLILGHPTQTCSDALRHLESSQKNIHVIQDRPTSVGSAEAIDISYETTLVPSRPFSNSFLEELDDCQNRGRNTIVVLDPRDVFNTIQFDSCVIGMIGAHKNSGVCKNIKLGRIQMVDWNPSWILSDFVCSKILV